MLYVVYILLFGISIVMYGNHAVLLSGRHSFRFVVVVVFRQAHVAFRPCEGSFRHVVVVVGHSMGVLGPSKEHWCGVQLV